MEGTKGKCPVCGIRHNIFPVKCIREVQNRWGYYKLSDTLPPEDLEILHRKVNEYERSWKT